MSEERYLREAKQYHDQLWAQAMRRYFSRRVVIKASTLAALGGASALNGLLAACGTGAQTQPEGLSAELAAGAYKYSRFPMIEKYNVRNLRWGGTPYLDGKAAVAISPPQHWDVVRAYISINPLMNQELTTITTGPGTNWEIPTIVPYLADRVTPARDLSYYDYHIRETYFHDIPPVNGRRLTAEDVAYSLEVYRTHPNSFHSAVLDFVERVEVLDKETVRVYAKRPVLMMDHVLATTELGVFAREHFEGNEDYWKQQPIGSGPFQITKSTYRQTFVGVRYPRYSYQPISGYQAPFLRELEGFYFADAAAQKAAFRTKQIDFYYSRSGREELEDILATNPDVVIHVQAPTASYNRIELQLKDPLFQDIRVRRALNMALDRPKMVETLFGGMGSPSHIISYHLLGRTDPFRWDELDQWHQYNPERAKQLLAEAGYPDGFEIEVLVAAPVSDFWVLVAEYFRAIGVRVRFDEKESTVVEATRNRKAFKHAVGGQSHLGFHAARPALQYFLPESPRNVSSVNDPKAIELVYRAVYSLDPDEQMRLFKELNDYGMDQCFAVETFSEFLTHYFQPWLHNIASTPTGWICCTGTWQWGRAWIDDTAPAGRAGRKAA